MSFNPRPRAEGDATGWHRLLVTSLEFQSAPSARRAIGVRLSRPSPQVRYVSIRALARRAMISVTVHGRRLAKFQSAPRAEGDTDGESSATSPEQAFQSAPRAEGDDEMVDSAAVGSGVSIRALARRAISPCFWNPSAWRKFQSAALARRAIIGRV